MATSLEKLVVSLEAESAKYQRELANAQKQLGRFEKDSNAVAARIGKNVGGALAAAFSVRQVAQWADSFTVLQNRLKLVTDGQQQLATASREVFDIAQRSRADMGATGELYFKIAQNAERLQITQEEVGRATETMAKAMALSGTAGGTAAGAIQQFSQALASGVLRGDEFNSVNEAAPAFMEALAQSAGVTRGELRKLAEDGKLSADLLIKALLDQASTIDEQYSKTASTLEQSLTRMDNAFVNLVGTLGTNTGVFAGTASLINAIADALDRIPGAAKRAGDELAAMNLPGMGGASPILGLGGSSFELLKLLGGKARSLAAGPGPVETGMSLAPPPLDPEGMSTGGISYGGYTLQQILAMEDANEKLAESMKKSASEAASGASAIQSQIDSLVQQAATLGMTSEQQAVYELRTMGATEAQIAQAEALARSISLFDLQEERKSDLADEDERLTSMARDYMAILDDLDGGTRAYGDALAELDVLVKAGNISLEQRTQIAGELEKQMKGLKDAGDFAQGAFEDIRGSFKSTFSDLLTDGKNWKDHLIGFVSDIGDAFADMAAEIATQALFGGTGSSGGGGFDWAGLVTGLLGAAAGSLGGAGSSFGSSLGTSLANTGITFNADGGTIPAGGWSVVGERGPELVYSHNAARVFSNEDSAEMLSGGARNTFNFNITTPNADSFRPAQKQIQRRARAELGV